MVDGSQYHMKASFPRVSCFTSYQLEYTRESNGRHYDWILAGRIRARSGAFKKHGLVESHY